MVQVTAFDLLAEACRVHPPLAALNWAVSARAATASLSQLGSARTVREPGKTGATLLITAPPDALPLVNRLHGCGWKRDGEQENWGAWVLCASLERDGACLKVTGATRHEPPHRNPALPYFADPPPELPHRVTAGFLTTCREWERKCAGKEW